MWKPLPWLWVAPFCVRSISTHVHNMQYMKSWDVICIKNRQKCNHHGRKKKQVPGMKLIIHQNHNCSISRTEQWHSARKLLPGHRCDKQLPWPFSMAGWGQRHPQVSRSWQSCLSPYTKSHEKPGMAERWEEVRLALHSPSPPNVACN